MAYLLKVFLWMFVAVVLTGGAVVYYLLHPAGKVVLAQKSPDGQYTVIVEEHQGGFAHFDDGLWDDDIYICANRFFGMKSRICNIRGASRANGIIGVDLSWPAPRTLKISYVHCSDDETRRPKSTWCGWARIKLLFCQEASQNPHSSLEE